MLDPFERWILFHGLRIETAPEHAPEFDLNDIVGKLQAAVDNNDAIQLRNNETASIRIADICVKDDWIEMLLQYADQKATDPSFLDMETYKLRKVSRLDGEGIAVSGHVVLSRKKLDDGSYQMLVEQVPGLTRSNINPFFRFIFKKVSKGHFTFEDETDNNKTKNYQPVSEVEDDPSSNFGEDLGNGFIEGVELISRRKDGEKEFDEEEFFREEVSTVKISVIKKTGDGILGKLEALKEKARKKGYSDFRIRYKKPEGKRRSVVMGTTVEDIAATAITKSELIKVNDPLEQCVDIIDSEFIKKVTKLL